MSTMTRRHKLRNFLTNMASLSAEDRCLIKCLRVEKRWNALQMMQEFLLRKKEKYVE